MAADTIPVHFQLTAFEMRILRLAMEERGLDPDDPDSAIEILVETSRRFVARREDPGGSEPGLPTTGDKFDELVLLCFAHGHLRSS